MSVRFEDSLLRLPSSRHYVTASTRPGRLSSKLRLIPRCRGRLLRPVRPFRRPISHYTIAIASHCPSSSSTLSRCILIPVGAVINTLAYHCELRSALAPLHVPASLRPHRALPQQISCPPGAALTYACTATPQRPRYRQRSH